MSSAIFNSSLNSDLEPVKIVQITRDVIPLCFNGVSIGGKGPSPSHIFKGEIGQS